MKDDLDLGHELALREFFASRDRNDAVSESLLPTNDIGEFTFCQPWPEQSDLIGSGNGLHYVLVKLRDLMVAALVLVSLRRSYNVDVWRAAELGATRGTSMSFDSGFDFLFVNFVTAELDDSGLPVIQPYSD